MSESGVPGLPDSRIDVENRAGVWVLSLHGEQLLALPGVRQTRTFFVMKEVVDNAPLDF